MMLTDSFLLSRIWHLGVAFLVCIWVWHSSTPPPARAADPTAVTAEQRTAAETLYRELYGGDATRILGSKSKTKTEAPPFAARLLAAAKVAERDPALRIVLLEHAIEFGQLDPAGYTHALDAARLLPASERRSERLVQLLDQLVKKEQYPKQTELAIELVNELTALAESTAEAGDLMGAVQLISRAKSTVTRYFRPADQRPKLAELTTLSERFETARKQSELRARLEEILSKNPTDPAANRDLGLLLLTQAGDTAAAASRLELSGVESLAALGKLLAQDLLSSHMELGDAYRKAAADVSAQATKTVLLAKARTHYEAFLAAEPANPASAKVKLILAELPQAHLKDHHPLAAPMMLPPGVVCLFEEQENWLQIFNKNAASTGAGALSLEKTDVYAGKIGLKLVGIQVWNTLPDWNYEICEKPNANQYRFLRLAWKKNGGNGIMIHVGTSADSSSWYRFYAAPNNPAAPHESRVVAKLPPTKWTVVIVDLHKEFGIKSLRGIGFSNFGGGEAYFDSIYLGPTVESVKNIRHP